MTDLSLSVAIGNYDRIRPLIDRSVKIDGVNPVFMTLEPEEIFFRAFRGAEFDICELSLSSFAVNTAKGESPYVGIPVFPSRMFRHTAFYVRTDRGIRSAADLKGRRIGTPEYQLTACVWCRLILEEDHGVRPSDIHWVRGGVTQPGRREKITLNLPRDVRIEEAPDHQTLSAMLEAGEIDGLIGPRAPTGFERRDPRIGWLFPDPRAAASESFRRNKIFPIMHLLGVRRSLVDAHPWLPFALMKAFKAAKSEAIHSLRFDTAAIKVSLPFVEESVREACDLMGEDYWSYGLQPNRHVLDTFLRHHHAQGLSSRRLAPEELFHAATLESFKI
jgi:4,5-dihydroxyphthalate decarboxylase